MFALAARPEEALALVGKVSPRTAPPTDRQINAWIGGLDSEDSAVRREASAMLLRAGETAFPHLRRTLEQKASEVARQRISLLLAAPMPMSDQDQLRTLRIIRIDPDQRRIGLSLKRVDSSEYLDLDWQDGYERGPSGAEEEPEPAEQAAEPIAESGQSPSEEVPDEVE